MSNNLNIAILRTIWENENTSPAPPIASTSFLSNALHFERQCKEHGGLSARDATRLISHGNITDPIKTDFVPTSKQKVELSPGSRLIRIWNGKTYTVSVIEEGFVYQDKVWTSLSAIARHITGAHWSGPRFFSTRTERIGS